jgi:hypothetical protein
VDPIHIAVTLEAKLGEKRRRKMKSVRALAIISLACGFVALHGTLARAEWSWDVYLGGAFSQEDDVTVSEPGVGSRSLKLDHDDSPTFGARGVYWSKQRPWLGVGLDLSAYFPDLEREAVFIVPLSGLVMFRKGLKKSPDYPRGRFQPYAGLGAGLFISNLSIELREQPIFALFGSVSDTSYDPGLDLRGGLKWGLYQRVMLFGEYRFTYTQPEYDVELEGSPVSVETKFITHHVLIGLSYSF